MATLKHLASKSADYGKPIKYLMFEHDRNGTPLRDADGNLIMRDSFILDGINCTPLYFDKECEMLNWQYRKNQNYNDIKSHHYILSFDPKDKEEGLLDPAHAHELGMEFAQRCFPGHQILVCTHSDGHHGSGQDHHAKGHGYEYGACFSHFFHRTRDLAGSFLSPLSRGFVI